VIFIDETDNIRDERFGEDFFSLIRSFYDRRAANPDFSRLSFGILGVASPNDLIRDKKRTAFNLGKAVDLRGFQLREAMPLAGGFRGMVMIRRSSCGPCWTGPGGSLFSRRRCVSRFAGSGFGRRGMSLLRRP